MDCLRNTPDRRVDNCGRTCGQPPVGTHVRPFDLGFPVPHDVWKTGLQVHLEPWWIGPENCAEPLDNSDGCPGRSRAAPRIGGPPRPVTRQVRRATRSSTRRPDERTDESDERARLGPRPRAGRHHRHLQVDASPVPRCTNAAPGTIRDEIDDRAIRTPIRSPARVSCGESRAPRRFFFASTCHPPNPAASPVVLPPSSIPCRLSTAARPQSRSHRAAEQSIRSSPSSTTSTRGVRPPPGPARAAPASRRPR